MATVNGTINSIKPNGSIWEVSVSIPTAALGALNLTIEVAGPIGLAAEQARQKLYDLGAELALNFQYPGNLA